ncbi:MAG: transposase [Acidimicrobiales bacterium]
MGRRFWSLSYFIASVGGAPISMLRAYIEGQRRPDWFESGLQPERLSIPALSGPSSSPPVRYALGGWLKCSSLNGTPRQPTPNAHTNRGPLGAALAPNRDKTG